MKNKFIIAAAAVLSVALITSCSIQKRQYRSGYHVEWKHSNDKTNQASDEKVEAQSLTQEQSQPQNIAVAKEEGTVTAQPTQSGIVVTENKASVPNAITTGTENSTNKTSKSDNTKAKISAKDVKSKMAAAKKSGGDVPKGLLIVLCFLMPWLAVGLATDWDVKTIIINLLWSLTCIGAIIHALIVVNRETK